MPLVSTPTEYKTLPQYDILWAVLGVFCPVPMSPAKTNPDFIIGEWGFASTIPISRYHIPLGLIFIPVMVLLAIIL